MVAMPSKDGFAGLERSETEYRWSHTEHQWKPCSSAMRQRRRRSSMVQSWGPAWIPKRIGCLYTIAERRSCHGMEVHPVANESRSGQGSVVDVVEVVEVLVGHVVVEL